jgi:hypothetical protein
MRSQSENGLISAFLTLYFLEEKRPRNDSEVYSMHLEVLIVIAENDGEY